MSVPYSPDMKYSDLNARHIGKIARLVRSHGGDVMATDWIEGAKAYNSQSIENQSLANNIDYGENYGINIWFNEKTNLINVEISDEFRFVCEALKARVTRIKS